MKKQPIARLLINLSILIASLVVTLFAVEIALRLRLKPVPAMFPPNISHAFRPTPEVMTGINGESLFSTNSQGVRGDEISRKDSYRVLAIGGSTTECLYLDDTEAWPYLVQERLNQNLDRRVWVGNVGRSGLTSRNYMIVVDDLLPFLGRIDAVVVLAGINDLSFRLSRDVNWRPITLPMDQDTYMDLRLKTFMVDPYKEDTTLQDPWYRLPELSRRVSILKQRIKGEPDETTPELVQDKAGLQYVQWRYHRTHARSIVDTLPNMHTALQEFAQNLWALATLCNDKGIRLILATQPAMWRPDLDRESQRLLWMGGIGPFQESRGLDYYSVGALSEAMDQYNHVLLRSCEESKVECIDLASLIFGDTTALYDDCHFNENGAELVADAIADYLMRSAPLAYDRLDNPLR